MPLILITGLAGSGKTTVRRKLKARGYEAYDGDKDRLAKWYNKATGAPVAGKDEEETVEFVNTHWRGIKREIIEKLALKAKDKTVFLCNYSHNEGEVRDLFDKIIALVVDEDTLKHRLLTRKGKYEWGRLPHELDQVLKSQETTHATYKKFNYVTIDATQPIDRVVEDVIKISREV